MKALALVDSPDHVCCRYRVRAFEPALAEAGVGLTIEGLAPGPVARWSQLGRAGQFDVVLLQRKLLPGWQLRRLRRHARRLVFDFDDAILYRDSYHPRGPSCPRRARRFAQTVALADTVIAGNDFLADRALRAGHRPERVRVIPTCVATERYRPALHPDDRPTLDLVWIGSSSTLRGLEGQRDLFERLARAVPSLRLRVICDRFPDLRPLRTIEVPWSEATEAAALAEGDVGITWIPDDLWSRGKCGLKVLQYQAAGLPVIANPVGTHPRMVREGIDGFLPTTPHGWVDAVRALAVAPELRRRMGRAARASVEARGSVAAWSPAFVATLLGGGPPPAARSSGETRALRPTSVAG